jgi:hypothetical protein
MTIGWPVMVSVPQMVTTISALPSPWATFSPATWRALLVLLEACAVCG